MRHRLLTASLVASASYAAYRALVRPWTARWGATDDELAMRLPGDEFVTEPAAQVTRAVTIDASAAEVWPWLVQLGADRGGFYSYDWLEDLFGLGIHSANRIVPEWQTRNVGDLVSANRAATGGWLVVEAREDDALALQLANVAASQPATRDDGAGFEFLWTFALRPGAHATTRLLVRERTAFGNLATRALLGPVGLVSFVMTRKMMLGIKQRAESTTPCVG